VRRIDKLACLGWLDARQRNNQIGRNTEAALGTGTDPDGRCNLCCRRQSRLELLSRHLECPNKTGGVARSKQLLRVRAFAASAAELFRRGQGYSKPPVQAWRRPRDPRLQWRQCGI